jgi:hypothetical protein
MAHLILSGLIWAFSFWMVADSLRRRASPLWVLVILLIQPYGGIAYLLYLKWSDLRRNRMPSPDASEISSEIDRDPSEPQPEPVFPLLDVADQLEEQGRFGEAAALYRRALEQQRDDARGLHGLARSLIELDQTREALETYEALMGIDPRYRNYAAALEYAEALHRAGRDADATGLLEGLVEETGRLNHRLALAHYCELSGETARAKSVLCDALAAYDSSPALEQQMNRRWRRRITDKLEALEPMQP